MTSAYFYLGRVDLLTAKNGEENAKLQHYQRQRRKLEHEIDDNGKKAGSAYQVDRVKTFVESSIRFSDDGDVNSNDRVKM